MASKYVSLEEAAELLGIPAVEVTRLRESNELRGFADRGTWKFQRSALEEYLRRHEAGSAELARSESVLADPHARSSATDESVGDQSTVIRKSAEIPKPAAPMVKGEVDSSSDVRIVDVIGDMRRRGDSSELELMEDTLDSGERKTLSAPAGPTDDLYDAVFGDDEDDATGTLAPGDSGIFAHAPGDSGIDLAQLDSSTSMAPQEELSLSEASTMDDLDSGLPLLGDSDLSFKQVIEQDVASTIVEPVSVSKDAATDSDTALLPGESGISLDSESSITLGGSNLSLSGEGSSSILDNDSGMILGDESGIALEGPESGIALEGPESGIALEAAVDGGSVKPPASSTQRMRQMEEAAAETEEESYDLDLDEGDATDRLRSPFAESEDAFETIDSELEDPVLVLGDEESDDHAPTMIQKSAKSSSLDDDEVIDEFDVDEEDVVIEEEEVFGEDDEVGDFEADEDFIEAGDADFEEEEVAAEDDEFGEERVPARSRVPAEPSWGIGAFLGLAVAVLLLSVNGLVIFESLRTMWAGSADPTPVTGLIDLLKETFRG